MGTRESYEPGTFSWVELATSDAEAAKRFYAELFGWEYDDNAVGDGMVYSMARRGGHHVGGLFTSDQSPPHWTSYVAVKSAEDTAKHAGDTGGTVLSGPFDVMDAGRMAVLQDPQGAVFAVWEAKDHIGAGLVNAPGALTWNDLMTSDVAGAAKFYCDLFGWEVAAVDPDGTPSAGDQEAETEGDDGDGPPAAERVSIRNGDRLNGGIATLPEAMGEAPAHWIPYFAVEDAAPAARRIGELGGRVVVEPMDIPAGKLAVAQDPQGALFAIFSGEFDD
ncbi:MAG: uncharacterized protein QOE86_2850 [Solirubrobacteraceae bacterium]|jgi:predicted enzyme related to lactoylglutathione lyase|nr:uncharacterized protein [Solirubrobacteraceae bacterium]